jgi:hypothetical protein
LTGRRTATVSTPPARARSARRRPVELIPVATATALAAPDSKPASPAPRTPRAASGLVPGRSGPLSAIPAPRSATTPTAAAAPTAAASASPAAATSRALETRTIHAATARASARPARATPTARWSAAGGTCATRAYAVPRAAGMASCSRSAVRSAMIGVPSRVMAARPAAEWRTHRSARARSAARTPACCSQAARSCVGGSTGMVNSATAGWRTPSSASVGEQQSLRAALRPERALLGRRAPRRCRWPTDRDRSTGPRRRDRGRLRRGLCRARRPLGLLLGFKPRNSRLDARSRRSAGPRPAAHTVTGACSRRLTQIDTARSQLRPSE